MTSNQIRKIFIISIAFVGVMINSVYGVELLKEFFNPRYNNEIREILISAIALEFGWAALLAWVIFKPFERRHLLLFTAISMMIGNLLHSINQSIYVDNGAGMMAVNLIPGITFAGIFVLAFFVGKPKKSEITNDA